LFPFYFLIYLIGFWGFGLGYFFCLALFGLWETLVDIEK